MEPPSLGRVVPTDASGTVVDRLFTASAGADDTLRAADDSCGRRFVARQVAFGGPADDACTGATFVAQGRVQLRQALHADRRARTIPPHATRLERKWSRQPHTSRTVHLSRASPTACPYGDGFRPALQTVSAPAHGSYDVPGETVHCRVTFRDGRGRRLHSEGALPAYGQFLRGEPQAVSAMTMALPCSPRRTMRSSPERG